MRQSARSIDPTRLMSRWMGFVSQGPPATLPSMSANLVDWVDSQLLESDLPDEVALIVLAALEGDSELDDYLADGTASDRHQLPSAADDVEASGVVLTSITVEGFRGIGSTATLDIAPKPGLTIVAGRNGSGKSSFSEALELVLTGDTYRWANRSAEWREQWRNLHHGSARISVGLVEEGSGPIQVTAQWPDGEKSVEARTVKAQANGQPQVDGIHHLGWRSALEQFRPILSYDELGGMLDGKQSELYDALASILGVQQLGDAVKRLKSRVAARKGPGQVAGTRRRELQARAAASTDDRGIAAAALLKKTDPDTTTLRGLATGGAQIDSGTLHGLRALASLPAPDPAAAHAAVDRLRRSRDALADAGAQVSQRNRDRLRLLDQGMALYRAHGDQSCPVCRTGDLDASWLATSQALVEHQRTQFDEVELAHQDFDLAHDAVRKLVQAPPSSLARPPSTRSNQPSRWSGTRGRRGPTCHRRRTPPALRRWPSTWRPRSTSSSPRSDSSAMRLPPKSRPSTTSGNRWRARSGAGATSGTTGRPVEPTVKQLVEAQKWLTENDLRLKNQRLAPIESGARDAWAKLRQESNVELDSLALAGSATRRRVQVSGAIDGEAVDSFAVFSQGELHALTLSLFLPRATLAQSPFRFVVLDDPVQAMDPAKVDGLVELLGELATTRQVIVFSHDDRLAAALRRSSYDATILEVTRGAGSEVTVDITQDPTSRYLNDAHGLIKEWQHGKLTEDDLRRTLPGLFRFAIESAAVDRYFATQLALGTSIHDLEAEWTGTHTTKKRVNLAIFGAQPAEHVSGAWTNLVYRKAALGVAAGGFHKGLAGWVDPEDAHHNTKRLIADIRNGTR